MYYHVLGTPQLEDWLVFDTPEHPEWMFGLEVSDDGRYRSCGSDLGCGCIFNCGCGCGCDC